MEVGCVDPSRLVFVDEMGTHTSLAPLYAYSPIGHRPSITPDTNTPTLTVVAVR